MAAIDGALCDVRLGNDREVLIDGFKQAWAGSKFEEGEIASFQALLAEFLAATECSMRFAVRATDFQVRVWQALREIAWGERRSYADVASMIGNPKAVRAVASAVARNPISLFIACHRIIYASGESGNYEWGADIKAALLALEANPGK